MSFLNKVKRGGRGIHIDHDLSTGLSRDLFVLDEVILDLSLLRTDVVARALWNFGTRLCVFP